MEYYSDLSWDKITTPINVEEFNRLLKRANYDRGKRKLIQGFKKGFKIQYHGSTTRQDLSDNLPLRDIGNEVDLWNKVMKEVKFNRYVGPFNREKLPFEHFIQSPIGLVPKAGGQTRLIFHLSYEFKNGNSSVNQCTPKEYCSVKYRDLDHAVNNCLKLLEEANQAVTQNMTGVIFYSKSDLKSTFRILPLAVQDRAWLIL